MFKNSEGTLADKIAGILSTTPASFDAEDSSVDHTHAQLLENYACDSEAKDQANDELSKFRNLNVDFLADVDDRYAGKKRSRKTQDSDNETDEDEDDSLESSSEARNSEEDVQEEEKDVEDENSSIEEDENESSFTEEDENESSSGSEEDDHFENNSNILEDEFKHIHDSDVPHQVKKGVCVRNQIKMWETLVEMRIQLQKCLITGNKMPDKQTFDELKLNSGQEFSNKVADTKTNLFNLLDKMLLLQKLVLNKFPDTKKLGEQNTDHSDEDIIPSDTEDDNIEEDIEKTELEETPKKKRKLQHYESQISNQHEQYSEYRNNLIKKWNDKTQLLNMKNVTISHSVLNQIKHTLSNKTKLIKRTQLKRSSYSILGENDSTTIQKENRSEEEYNSNIFDDDDFYHQLLRELIQVKSADLTDPVQLGRQWVQLQNIRKKMKRVIDTRASKGRKIRYTVHSKLVNFMAPIDKHLYTDEAKNKLYSSLFGSL